MLNQILDYKKLELEHVRRKVGLKDVKLMVQDAVPPIPFLRNFGDSINVIAEIKKASPSAGVIRQQFNPVDIAEAYIENGAKALSVLTDEHFFQGHLEYLRRIKDYFLSRSDGLVPCLRKDFTLDEYHVFEARAAGADAILLIVAALDKFQLKDYHDLAMELGMKVIVEVHDKPELEKALRIYPRIIGINNRNLKTFETSVETTKELKKSLDNYERDLNENIFVNDEQPATSEIVVISESGLSQHETLLELHNAGIQGFLIGEALMRENDFGKKLQELIYGF